MAREKGNLISCLSKMAHHVAPDKAILMLLGPELPVEILEYRFKLIRDEVATVEGQIQKIKTVAQEKGYKEITDILDEEVEYGHDF